MRNSLLLLALILSCNCTKENLQPNSIVNSFIENNMVWYISEYPNHCPRCVWPHKITFGKDTIINTYTYREVLDFQGELNEEESKVTSLGYIRETSDNTVFWHVSFFGRPSTDILIYDFGAQINDTIDNYWIVTNIDTVDIFGIGRKRIELKSCASTQEYWIEGIGDMSDLLSYKNRPICGFDSGVVGFTAGVSMYKLNCVEEDSNLIFKNSESGDCWFYVGGEEKSKSFRPANNRTNDPGRIE